MGLLDLIQWNAWTLQSLEPLIFIFLEGQFQPENGAEDSAQPELSNTATAGSAKPTVSYVHGGLRHVVFKSSFVSKHMLDLISLKLAALDAAGTIDSTLGRAPRVAFSWGTIYVEGFASVRKRITGFWELTGWPRTCEFEIEIAEAAPLDFTGTPLLIGETQFVTLGAGETFETLGQVHLGDPSRGELIRRINPEIATGESPGDRVRIFEKEHPAMRRKVAPTAPPFIDRTDSGDTWQPLVEALAADRSVQHQGIPWDQQPDVVAGLV